MNNSRRRIVQWVLLWVVVATVLLGWKYPLLGFSVPAVMLTGVAVSLRRGRYVCGNLCPRGAFFDRVIGPVSRGRGIPPFFRNVRFRVILLALLIGFMVYRISLNPGDIRHWGHVFWLMCVITTGIGVLLGVFLHRRAWCAFCPMGSAQNFIGGGKRPLLIDGASCIGCVRCEKACPLDLKILRHKDGGVMGERDCLRCSECVPACPRGGLSWGES